MIYQLIYDTYGQTKVINIVYDDYEIYKLNDDIELPHNNPNNKLSIIECLSYKFIFYNKLNISETEKYKFSGYVIPKFFCFFNDKSRKILLENYFPEQLKNSFVKKFTDDKIIWMNKINTLYVATKNQKLIYGTSIFNHKIIYVSLVNGNQYSMILEIDNKDYKDFYYAINENFSSGKNIIKIILRKNKKKV
jgi:hypothetical protein